MPTIKQTAILTLTDLGFAEIQPGKWAHPQFHNGTKPLYVYVGRSHSIRKGTTKANSVPISLLGLRMRLESSKHPEPLVQPERERGILTELRRDLHGMIGKLNEGQCRELVDTIANMRTRDDWRGHLQNTYKDVREGELDVQC